MLSISIIYLISRLSRLFHALAALLLDRPKDYLTVLLLLLIWELRVPATVECTAPTQLLHFLCVFGHESIVSRSVG